MRAMKAFAVGAFLLAGSAAADAQSTRHFRDSWFWGLKGGGMLYQVSSDQQGDNSLAPLAGIDWVITRSRGGMYVSFDHSFFKDQFVFVNDSLSPLDTVPRRVDLSGMRRFTIAGVFFPLKHDRIHPYFGLGATLSHIAKAEPENRPYRNSTQQLLVEGTIQQYRSTASPLVMVGTQVRLLYFSAFAQATASPAHSQFFLFTGNNWRTSVEAGLRYNVGSSIDRLR